MRGNKSLGIIAEDDSDVETLEELIKKITAQKFSIKNHVGRGCGKIKRKCNAWANNLKLRGCKALILLHDLDNNDLKVLHDKLTTAISPCPINHFCIVIPIQELEAWLLSDSKSLQKTFNLNLPPKIPVHPEKINSPKEFLEKLILKSSKNSKIYLNTKHNKMIASNLSITELSRKCQSFHSLHTFIKNNFN